MSSYKVTEFVAFDLETTGLSPYTDDILEIGAVKFKGDRIERFNYVVKPRIEVPLKIARLTKITESEIAEGVEFSSIASSLQEFIGDLPLVGHNSPFDTAFLAQKLEGFPSADVHDTLEMARILFPTLRSYRLQELAKGFGVHVSAAHRAYDDAEVSGKLFIILQKAITSMPLEKRLNIAAFLADGSPFKNLLLTWGDVEGEDERRYLTGAADDFVPCEETKEWALKVLENNHLKLSRTPLRKDAAQALAFEANVKDDGIKRLIVGVPGYLVPKGAPYVYIPERYICLRKLELAGELYQKGDLPPFSEEEEGILPIIASWTDMTDTGDFRELALFRRHGSFLKELSCSSINVCPEGCAFIDRCFQKLAKERESSTFFSDYEDVLSADGGNFGQVVIFDARSFSSSVRWNEKGLDTAALGKVLAQEKCLEKAPSLKMLHKEATACIRKGVISEAGIKYLDGLKGELGEIVETLKEGFSHYDADPPFLSRNLHEIEDALETVRHISGSFPDLVTAERRFTPSGQSVAVFGRSVFPGEAGVKKIEDSLGPVRLTLNQDFLETGPVLGRYLGVENWDDLAAPDLKKILCLSFEDTPSDMRQLADYLKKAILTIARKIRKGFYVVFPSRSLLQEVYKISEYDFEEEGIAIYALGVDGGAGRVFENLGEEDAVIFSTARARPPGPDLPDPKCVLIPRVPFNAPNPLDDTRRNWANSQGLQGFLEVNVKDAVSLLVPHLVRMLEGDQKCSLILSDPRLNGNASPWGDAFLKNFLGDKTLIPCTPREAAVKTEEFLN